MEKGVVPGHLLKLKGFQMPPWALFRLFFGGELLGSFFGFQMSFASVLLNGSGKTIRHPGVRVLGCVRCVLISQGLGFRV